MQIFWSDTAKFQLKEIYEFYSDVAGPKIAVDMKAKLFEKCRVLKSHPEIGQLEDNPIVAGRNFRYLVEGHHKIVYKVYGDQEVVLIAAVFDTRQNPGRLKI